MAVDEMDPRLKTRTSPLSSVREEFQLFTPEEEDHDVFYDFVKGNALMICLTYIEAGGKMLSESLLHVSVEDGLGRSAAILDDELEVVANYGFEQSATLGEDILDTIRAARQDERERNRLNAA